MTDTIKVLGATANILTTNTVFTTSRRLRLINSDAALGLVTIFDTVANTQIGSVILLPSSEIFLEIEPGNVLSCNTAGKVFAVPVGY